MLGPQQARVKRARDQRAGWGAAPKATQLTECCLPSSPIAPCATHRVLYQHAPRAMATQVLSRFEQKLGLRFCELGQFWANTRAEVILRRDSRPESLAGKMDRYSGGLGVRVWCVHRQFCFFCVSALLSPLTDPGVAMCSRRFRAIATMNMTGSERGDSVYSACR